jgi:hypothetical protein
MTWLSLFDLHIMKVRNGVSEREIDGNADET